MWLIIDVRKRVESGLVRLKGLISQNVTLFTLFTIFDKPLVNIYIPVYPFYAYISSVMRYINPEICVCLDVVGV